MPEPTPDQENVSSSQNGGNKAPSSLYVRKLFRFAIYILLAVQCLIAIECVFLARPALAWRDPPNLPEAQAEYNQQNPYSGEHDAANQRGPTSVDTTPPVHKSRPAPDKTSWEKMYQALGVDLKRRQDLPGAIFTDLGWQTIYGTNIENYPTTPLTNGQFAQAVQLWLNSATQIGQSPEAQLASAVTAMQQQQAGAANATGKAGIEALKDILAILVASNVNVANEAAGTPGSTTAPFRPVSQAVWMVQQMYHRVYLPLAILLLLPGAVILQMKALIAHSLLGGGDEDSQGGPFGHIMRALIAIFLIPATQLILSYSIDVGNSLSYEAARQVDVQEIYTWVKSQYDADTQAVQAQQAAGANPEIDPRPTSQQTFDMAINALCMFLLYGLLIVFAFQMVMSCYLMLLGPVAAALYTWPGLVGRLFRNVFTSWVDAVVNLSLWRFWWVMIVLAMVTRIQWLKEIGEYVPNTEWETLMFMCFLVMMCYVPFSPFELKPGELVDRLLSKAKEMSGGGGSGSPGGAGANGAVPAPAPNPAGSAPV